jgi:hypothetical protein
MILMGIQEGCRVQIARVNELGRVVAGGQANMDRVRCPGGPVVVFQSLSKRMRRDAHDRIYLGIKILRPSQGLDGNAVLLDFVDCSVEVLFANKTQESAQIVRTAKHSRRQNRLNFSPLGLKPVDYRLQVRIPQKWLFESRLQIYQWKYNLNVKRGIRAKPLDSSYS